MSYLLDTNICIYIINKKPAALLSRLTLLQPEDIKISSIVLAELEYGVFKSKMQEKNRAALHNFVSSFEIIPFDQRDVEIFGLLRAELEHRGEVIGPYDMMIAAQAISRAYTLVTNNIKEFQRIPQLNLENWVN
jgi:tRNA(fMet)-specific endonuclease VapC